MRIPYRRKESCAFVKKIHVVGLEILKDEITEMLEWVQGLPPKAMRWTLNTNPSTVYLPQEMQVAFSKTLQVSRSQLIQIF